MTQVVGGHVVHRPAGSGHWKVSHARVVLLAVAITAMAVAVIAMVVALNRPTRTTQPSAGGTPPSSAHFNRDGRDPAAAPMSRFALGFLRLEDPLDKAVGVFGAPSSSEPDLGGTDYIWELGHGARLIVTAADEQRHPIIGLMAQLPSASGARFSLFGGAVLGSSPLGDVISAWGSGYQPAADPSDDFAVMYALCKGHWPVVVKFDQETRNGRLGMDEQALRAPVTSALIAYADADPVASGCATGTG